MSAAPPPTSIVVFAKRPRPGFVKTRMTPPLSSRQASDLYAHLLDDVLAATAAFSDEQGLFPVLAVHPPEACGELARRAPTGFRVVAQRGVDLSQRMDWAVREAAAGGARRVLLRGSDSPLLDGAVVREITEALEGSDVAICPDRDGGYNLIGLREPIAGLFDHPMSTRSVLDDTLANAKSLGYSSHVLEPGFDLDTAHDLLLLAAERARRDLKMCHRTLAYLDENRLWEASKKWVAESKTAC
ncbi:MAG: glycosyltransferase [Myxococcales bacterium]|nr:glycosyltransferase [Myxococcales bacterium]